MDNEPHRDRGHQRHAEGNQKVYHFGHRPVMCPAKRKLVLSGTGDIISCDFAPMIWDTSHLYGSAYGAIHRVEPDTLQGFLAIRRQAVGFLILLGLTLLFLIFGAGLIGHILGHSKKPPLPRD